MSASLQLEHERRPRSLCRGRIAGDLNALLTDSLLWVKSRARYHARPHAEARSGRGRWARGELGVQEQPGRARFHVHQRLGGRGRPPVYDESLVVEAPKKLWSLRIPIGLGYQGGGPVLAGEDLVLTRATLKTRAPRGARRRPG